MAKRQVELVILCEDLQQEVCARQYFTARNFHPRKIRYQRSPTGQGSGEQWVREQYPIEVKTHRSRVTYATANLVVLIDADTNSVAQRLRALDQALNHDGLSKREAHEKIAIFVPKRNIETWIHFLRGENINEVDVYPKLQRESECKTEVEKLASVQDASDLPPNPPPSLQTACDELKRIL